MGGDVRTLLLVHGQLVVVDHLEGDGVDGGRVLRAGHVDLGGGDVEEVGLRLLHWLWAGCHV